MNTLNKQTILVVDDAPENIDVLTGLLESIYNVKIATSGEQALKIVATHPVDLILLDVMMPEMDGYEVCRRLNNNPATREIPIIFVTSLGDDEDEIKGLTLGAVDYLTKPIHASIALARIRNHLDLKLHRDALQALNRELEQRVRDEVSKSIESERINLLGRLFDLGREGVLITDASSTIVAVNKAFTTITGFGKKEVLGKTPKILQSGRHGPDFYVQLWHQLTEHGFWQGEVWNKRKDGTIYPEWLSISVIRDPNGKVANYISTFTDISEHMQVQEKMRHMALHDHLTGLPNRAAFNEQLERDFFRAQRHQSKLAVLMLDLDHFKEVNDTLGHAAGDLLLIGVAGRMQACLRRDDFVCRLGGDEFVAIMHDVRQADDIKIICDKLLHSVAEPFMLDGHEARVSLSMGIAIYPDNGHSEKELMENADAALYQTKNGGRAGYSFSGDTKVYGHAE